MMSKSFGVRVYLKKSKNYESGSIPIYLRIIVDGKRTEISTKRICD
jgi:hypothetical protein